MVVKSLGNLVKVFKVIIKFQGNKWKDFKLEKELLRKKSICFYFLDFLFEY